MVIHIVPIGKPRMTRAHWTDAAQRYFTWKDEFKLLYPFEMPEQVSLIFFLPMPQSWSKKKKAEMSGKPHQSKPDIDNLVKAVLDAANVEDKNVWMVNAAKYWGVEGSIFLDTLG